MHTQPVFISLAKAYEVRHWMRALHCTQGDLYLAVTAVGKHLPDLQAYLTEHSSHSAISTCCSASNGG